MASYESFARVYDIFMSDTPYDEWCEYLHSLLLRYGVAEGLVLELGCGTGQMTERLAARGYDMIGVDNSLDMLEIAREKMTERQSGAGRDDEEHSDSAMRCEPEEKGRTLEQEMEPDILYLLQDMREFELYGTVRAVVSICDSMNYITEEEDLLQVFRLVNNYLDPGGVLIFDLNTLYKYEEILAENVFAENRDEGSFIWENWYDPETQINEYDLTLYIQSKSNGYRDHNEECDRSRGCGNGDVSNCAISNSASLCGSESSYERYEEVHYQKAYTIDCVRELLQKAGLHLEAVYDAFTLEQPRPESERVYFVAREEQKKQAAQKNGSHTLI
ncbi:MAG: class I SAM-dependent methyltransferase [Clostridiales bacterium]|nr:class I SAM-dependent methyltransferase [Clostridiales bacterium]